MHGLGERAMNSILRFVQVFALGTWVGSIIYLSFVVTRGAFGLLQSRDQAGLVVGYSLVRLHYMGMVAAVLYLVAGFALAPSLKAFVQPAMLGVFFMLLLTVVSQTRVTPRLAELRTEMVSVDATPKDNPLRVEFDRLHQTSVRIEVVVLLLGIVSLFFTVRNAGK
jgi:NO-binding membrane sensor protein with MHYT domain